MNNFEKALNTMSATIFPGYGDIDGCARQANVLFAKARAMPLGPEECKTFELAVYWNRLAIKYSDERHEAFKAFDKIFGDFITESLRQCLGK